MNQFGIFFISLFFQLQIPGNTHLERILASDYLKLSNFTSKLTTYNIDEAQFHSQFLKGLHDAIGFYERDKIVSGQSLQKIIKREIFRSNPEAHPILAYPTSPTTRKAGIEVFNSFSGTWHGKWQNYDVHHLWLPVREHALQLDESYKLLAFQSAFTGDGIGWNYIVSTEEQVIMLGYVFHYDESGALAGGNPHYAQLNSDKGLTWVSDNHIYFESICDNDTCFGRQKHYVISGGQYERRKQQVTLLDYFQAVYLSHGFDLPDFIAVSKSLEPIKSSGTSWLAGMLRRFIKVGF